MIQRQIYRIRLKFTAELSYCTEVAQKVKTFLEGELAKNTLLGIGVAIPGIIDQKERIVLNSPAFWFCPRNSFPSMQNAPPKVWFKDRYIAFGSSCCFDIKSADGI